MKQYLLLPLLLITAACVNSSQIVTGTVRPAIAVEDVRIYLEPPKKYEAIAILEAFSGHGSTQQEDSDMAMAEIKKKAAALGANGVLLTHVNSESGMSSGYATIYGSGKTAHAVYSGGYANQSEIKALAIYTKQ